MDHQIFKIYNSEDFDRITKGIKVAQCMQSKSSYVPQKERVLKDLEDLVISDSLRCSFCDTVFEDKIQQRLHYKLDWHCYNLKLHLNGLKSITEDSFNMIATEGNISSLSGSEVESECEDEASTCETGSSVNDQVKNESGYKSSPATSNKSKKSEKRPKKIESILDCYDNEEMSKKKKTEALLAVASRHSKVFFENDDGKIFSIYRCLLHHKKDIPEVDNELIAHALNSGKKTTWTVVMVSGGHFAGAIFQNGEPIVHKTFHSYTVRAKQGFAQSSRAGGNHPKSAGSSLRKYNEMSLIQHVQQLLESWSTHIVNSSLLLYRAVGRYNRTVLFGGKNPPFDKGDSRLRPLPFPTRRPTFNEVKRVHDILSNMEIYGSAANFTDSFPYSPRQPIRRKTSKAELMNTVISEGDVNKELKANSNSTSSSQQSEINKSQTFSEGHHRNPRSHIDRAKPRKSPNRPLPDIVAKLAQLSSDAELDEKDNSENDTSDIQLIEQDIEIEFKEHLLAFQDTVPKYMKNKKARRQKRKMKKDVQVINEVLTDAKIKLWTACKLGDNDLLSSSFDNLLTEVKRCEELQKQNNEENYTTNFNALVNMDDVIKLVNGTNEDGNTLLHLAALGGHSKLVWSLLEIGSNPCNKNKKLQTPYTAACNKETKNTFRRFMGDNPDKFDYQKSQIPGPLTDEIEQEESEKKRQQRKAKRLKDKVKRKEFEIKKQEENEKQRFLSLSDREKRALAAEKRMLKQGYSVLSRCFQCAVDMTNQMPFEYNANRFCSMPCLKEHRLHNKVVT